MAGKGSKDTRTPNLEKRRQNLSKINWCKHDWKELSGDFLIIRLKCTKCGAKKEC